MQKRIGVKDGDTSNKKNKVFSTGAQRDERGFQFNFHSISPHALRRLAMIHFEGDTRYGYCNWRKGMPYSNIVNHIFNHFCLFLSGDRSEDHIAKTMWGCGAIMEFEAVYGDKFDDLPPAFMKKFLQETRKNVRQRHKRFIKRRRK